MAKDDQCYVLALDYGGLLCVVEIAEVLNEHPSVVSNHLATLRAVKLVSREWHGAYAYYFVNAEALEKYQQFLEQLISSREGTRSL